MSKPDPFIAQLLTASMSATFDAQNKVEEALRADLTWMADVFADFYDRVVKDTEAVTTRDLEHTLDQFGVARGVAERYRKTIES